MMRFIAVLDSAMRKLSWIPNWTLFAALLIVLVQASDREPPFRLLSVEPAFARPGETVTIKASVWRDMTRDCSVDVHRSLHDARGDRWDYATLFFSSASIAMTEARTPGRMAPTLLVPLSANPGPAEFVTALEYRCNKTHALWPIETTHKIPFTVLPP